MTLPPAYEFDATTRRGPTSQAVPSFDLTRRPRIDRYVLIACVEADARAEVFRAHDPVHRCDVVVRLMRDVEVELAACALLQARALTKLEHPNVEPVHDAGTHWGRVFVAKRSCCDPTLDVWLRKPRLLHEREAALLAAGRGLCVAHAAGVVHGDFSAARVLVAEHDSSGALADRVRVTGFAAERCEGMTSCALATHAAPELGANGPPTTASDQFAFCATTLLALAAPSCVGDPREGSPRLESPGLVDVLMRGLSTDPRDRWPSMGALLAQVAAAQPT